MAEVVPTFHDPEEVNRKAEETEEMKEFTILSSKSAKNAERKLS